MRILETGNTTHEMVAIKGNMPNPTVDSFEYNFPFFMNHLLFPSKIS